MDDTNEIVFDACGNAEYIFAILFNTIELMLITLYMCVCVSAGCRWPARHSELNERRVKYQNAWLLLMHRRYVINID